MTTTPAATALSDLNAPQFSIITKALGPAAEGGDGRRRFHATASSTIVDRSGHQISRAAIEKMADKFRDGITIFMDHKNVVGNAYGTTDEAQVIQRGQDKMGTPIWDLDIYGVVNDPNPVAKQLHDSIEGGYVKLGCSIDAFVTAKPTVQKSGSLLIDSLDVFAASVVGVPMNQRSWTQKAVRAVKSFYGEPQEDDVSEDLIETPVASGAVLELLEKSSEALEGLVEAGIEIPADGTMSATITGDGSGVALPLIDDEAGPAIEKVLTTQNSGLAPQVTLDQQDANNCPTCGHTKGDGGDCTNNFHNTESKSIEALADQIITKSTTEGGQDAVPAATPEITPESEDTTKPAEVQKAMVFETDDVVALVGHVQTLAKGIEVRDEKIDVLSKSLTNISTDRDRLAAENEMAKQVIEKMLAMPLRPKTVGYVATLQKNLPDFFAPEVKDYLNKRETAGDKS